MKSNMIEEDDILINEGRREFVIDIMKKSSATALLLTGFVSLSSEAANQQLSARVVAGSVARRFIRNNKEVESSNSVGIANADTATADKDVKIVHLPSKAEHKVRKIEMETPDAIWSQSGTEKTNDDSNTISIIIANNSGKTVKNIEPVVAKIIDLKRPNKSEVKVAIKPKEIKPGVTIHEVKVSNLPKKGVKKVRIAHKSKKIPGVNKIKKSQSLSSNKVVIASNKEVKDVRTRKMSGTRLFEKYISYSSINVDVPIINDIIPSVPSEKITPYKSATGCLKENGTGSREFNKYVGCKSG